MKNIEWVLDKSKELRNQATPGPFYADLGNSEIESRHDDFFRKSVVSRGHDDGVGEDGKKFRWIDSDNDLIYAEHALNVDALKDQIIMSLVGTISLMMGTANIEDKAEACSLILSRGKRGLDEADRIAGTFSSNW